MADNMKKKSPSFPSNYVTLVQLQERWLKEKERKKREEEEEDRRQKQSQLEDEASETRKVEPESMPPSQLRPTRRGSPEASAPVVELARDGGGGADRGEKMTAKKKKNKNKSKKKGKSGSQKKLGSMAEDEVAVKEPPLLNVEKDGVGGEARGEVRAESGGLNRTAGLEAESRVSSRKGGKKKSHERRTTGGEARAESDILNEKTELGTKSWALSVNVVIGAEDEMLLRRNGGGDNIEVPARRNREKRRGRSEGRVERNGLDRSVDVESQFRVLSVNGETVKKNGGLGSGKGKKRSGETRAENDTLHPAVEIEPELRAESSGLDRSVSVESQMRALSVNGKTVKKNDGQRRSGRGKRTSGETRAESDSLDRAAEIEPELWALPVNGVAGERNEHLRRNGKKQDGSLRRNRKSRRTGDETRQESNELDQTAGIEPEVRNLPVNGWVRKATDGSRGKVAPVIKNEESRGGRVETRAERTNLDETADIEPRFRALSVNGETKEGNGLRRNGVKEESQGTEVETMVEGNRLNQMNGIEPEIRTVSAYGRTGKGNDSRFGRTSAGYNRGFRESWSSAYGKFSQREGLKGRDSGMVWVKKGEA